MQHLDPLEKQRFGGEPSQLEHIASYLKAIQDLEKRSLGGADPGEDGGKKGKKGKKQKEDELNDQWRLDRRCSERSASKKILCHN